MAAFGDHTMERPDAKLQCEEYLGWTSIVFADSGHSIGPLHVLSRFSVLITLETNRHTESALTPPWGCAISMTRPCKLMGPTMQAVQWRLMCALSKQMTSIDSLENGDDIASTRGRRNCQKCSALGVGVHMRNNAGMKHLRICLLCISLTRNA